MTARALLAIRDPAERANTAIALFGTPVEDLSVDQIPQFLKALADVRDNLVMSAAWQTAWGRRCAVIFPAMFRR